MCGRRWGAGRPALVVGCRERERKRGQPLTCESGFSRDPLLAAAGKDRRQSRLPVRPQAHPHSTVEVRVGVGQGPVVEGNCVAAMRGGKQPEANWRSVG